jgi:hypothetical protein
VERLAGRRRGRPCEVEEEPPLGGADEGQLTDWFARLLRRGLGERRELLGEPLGLGRVEEARVVDDLRRGEVTRAQLDAEPVVAALE